MLNLLVETKNEYTLHLSNVITPLIFEGIQSIYKEALKISDITDVLKIFQTYLKRIPKWNQNLIEKETERIMNSSHSYEWLDNLIKATLKSNLIVLMYNPTIRTQQKIDSTFYKNISSKDFIHKVYIECAREIWNNPYLLYHNYPPIEIKRNQRDCMNIIKDCIKEALRKLLPVKHILSIYLGEDAEEDNNDNNFERNISEAEKKNLTKIIKKDLLEDNKELEYKIFDENIANNDSKSDTKTIGSKILKIINTQNINGNDIIGSLENSENDNIIGSLGQSENNNIIGSLVNSQVEESTSITSIKIKTFDLIPQNSQNIIKNSIDNDNDTSDNIILNEPTEEINDNSSINELLDNDTSENDSEKIKNTQINNNLDNKIRKILYNDLKEINTETDIESSYNDLKDTKYQEIFSNDKLNNQNAKKIFKDFMEF